MYENILLAIDDSEHSKHAIEKVIASYRKSTEDSSDFQVLVQPMLSDISIYINM